MPDYQIVLTSPDDSLVSSQISIAPSVWDEFFQSGHPPLQWHRPPGFLAAEDAIGGFPSIDFLFPRYL